MDGLSAAASIIAVVQITTSIASALKEYYESVRNARQDIERLYASLNSLMTIMTAIQDLEQRYGSSLALLALLKDENGPLQSIMLELKTLEKSLGTNLKPTGKTAKLIRSMKWPFQRADVEKTVGVIDREKATISLQLAFENLNTNLKSTSTLEDFRSQQDLRSQRLVIEWLSKGVPDPAEEQNLARERYQSGTGSWLLENHKFKAWTSRRNSFLWLNGGGGAGKTILCSTVINHLQKLCADDPEKVVAYWYFTFSNVEKQNVSNLLRSLIKDICSNRDQMPPALIKAFDLSNRGQQRPGSSTLVEILKEAVEGFKDIYLVIDGLDECPKVNLERSRLLETLEEVFSYQLEQLHILVTSRLEADIKGVLWSIPRHFGCFHVLEVQGSQCQNDIKVFLEQRLNSRQFIRWKPGLKHEVKQELLSQAHGMFRLVALQLDSLVKCRSEANVRTTMKSLPKTLDSFYERILLEIDENDQEQAFVALQWIAYAARDIALDELAEAMIINGTEYPYLDTSQRFMDPDYILDMLPGGLITTRAEGRYKQTIRIAHYSVLEFLVSSRIPTSLASHFQMSRSTAIITISEGCIAYLIHISENEFQISPKLYRDFPLLHYAAVHWTEHLRSLQSSQGYSQSAVLEQLCLQFLDESCNAWNFWLHFGGPEPWNSRSWFVGFNPIRTPRDCLNTVVNIHPLSWVSGFGLDHWVHKLLTRIPAMDEIETDDTFGLPLYAAAFNAQESTLRLLCDSVSDINVRGGRLGTALHVAVFRGHLDLAETLLEFGADINSKDGLHGTPLSTAIRHMPGLKNNTAVIELLLDKGADVNISPELGESWHHSLITAVGWGTLGVVNQLLERGADIEAVDRKYGTPLQAAAYFRKDGTAHFLIYYGADANAPGGEFGGPAEAAAFWGHEDMLRLLLAEGANANGALQTQVRERYKTPLQLAIEREHIALVSALTYSGAVPSAGGNWAVVCKDLRLKIEMLTAEGTFNNWRLGRCKSILRIVENWMAEPENQVLPDEESDLYEA